ncbi:GH92 family glycosyl hydrolase [Olivibacter sp. XZL3]|uniref:GH92 family glycosyl hydrolase n=1 Tax=Olivibacter sp. XZL3 TaxID=1735116 RepID=UPI001F0F723E|nr:GH92 family glycosyl hydrolase [Olivibacter sp. XZL3]
MKYFLATCGLLLGLMFFSPCEAQQNGFINYVQPLAGTAASTTSAAKKHSEANSEQYANTVPAVGTPFAMTQWTPQTRKKEQKCVAPYYYSDSLINGFRASHWLSGSCTQDYGSFSIMPVSGSLQKALQQAESPFSHNSEQSSPAYYQVILDHYKLRVELTASSRCGIMRITALKSDSVYVLVNANSDEEQGQLHITENNEIVGKNPVYRIYQGSGEYAGFDGHLFFNAEKVPQRKGSFNKGTPDGKVSVKGGETSGVYMGFFLKKGETLCLKMGTSFTGAQGAEQNLRREIPSCAFERVKQRSTDLWEESLEKIRIRDNDEGRKRIFYTAMYHAMQHPRLFNDVDGRYPKFAHDNEYERIRNGAYYDDFSMWDIYRAQMPLLEIVEPQLVDNMVASLLIKGEQGGWLPIFPCWNNYTAAMIGDHAVSLIVSAYLKGIRQTEAEKAYALMRKNAFVVADSLAYHQGKGRRALSSYLHFNYIPMEDSVPVAFHKKEQVSRTLEYAYDDYALAMFAQYLGKETDYEQLLIRAKNYRNVFDKEVGMMRGRFADGTWYEPFNPGKREPYITEGTAHQYTFYVPQDIPGLAKVMGGQVKLEQCLDRLFLGGGYWHGNEPGHQIPFLYNYTRSPWKTQARVRQLLEEEYSDGPGGLSGNDDAGQMSAWYVFASLGFYPVDPISGSYLLTSPFYKEYEMLLPDGKKWIVTCDKDPEDHPYIRSVRLNGRDLGRNYIRYEEIMRGGQLEFYLAKEPTAWGANEQEQVKGLAER